MKGVWAGAKRRPSANAEIGSNRLVWGSQPIKINFHQALAFYDHRAHKWRMDKINFDDTDYSVVVKNRAPLPSSWRWEIYRAGRATPIGHSPAFFHTMAGANKEGKVALKQLLAKLDL